MSSPVLPPSSLESVVVSRRDVVKAEGPDTIKFLHALVSQDVVAMTNGETRWSLLLTPQGRLVSHFRLRRISSDEFQLDVEAGHGLSLISALKRYLIRTKCALTITENVAVSWRSGESGSASSEVVPDGISISAHPLLGGVDTFATNGGALGLDTLDTLDTLDAEQRWDDMRIVAGLPRMGSELDESVIPNGTGLLTWSVSFGKGCYVGQELVERIDSRAATVPTRLCRISLPDQTPEAAETSDAADATDANEAAGTGTGRAPVRVTSSSRTASGWVGLGWVSRALAVGDSSNGVTVLGEVGLAVGS